MAEAEPKSGSFFSQHLFHVVMLSTLAVFGLYILLLLWAQGAFVDWGRVGPLLRSSELWSAVRLSLITATLSCVLALVVAVPSAYALARYRFFGSSFLDALVDLPIVLSPIAVGTLILMLFRTSWGELVDRHLIGFLFAVPGIVLAQFTVITALAIRLLKSSFESVDRRYEEVAQLLGCSRAKVFLTVTLPLARNGIIAAAIMTWARALGEFGATMTVAGTIRGRTETLPAAVFLSLSTADIARTVTLASIMVILAFMVLLLLRVCFDKRRKA